MQVGLKVEENEAALGPHLDVALAAAASRIAPTTLFLAISNSSSKSFGIRPGYRLNRAPAESRLPA